MAIGTRGSLTLFKNGEPLKSIQLQGLKPLVRFVNGEIVSAGRHGKLTVLNKELDILKTFHGTQSDVRTMTGNDKYIAMGDYDGAVRYYDRAGAVTPKVSKFFQN